MLFSVYTLFTSEMLVPEIGGFYKEKLGLTSLGALTALVGGGLTGMLLGKELSILGLAVSAVLLIFVSLLDRRHAKAGPANSG
jgi:hypothetical protein